MNFNSNFNLNLFYVRLNLKVIGLVRKTNGSCDRAFSSIGGTATGIASPFFVSPSIPEVIRLDEEPVLKTGGDASRL